MYFTLKLVKIALCYLLQALLQPCNLILKGALPGGSRGGILGGLEADVIQLLIGG